MKLAVIILALVSVTMACSTKRIKDEFDAFRRTYRKVYKDQAEEDYRCTVFAENFEKVEQHNTRQARGLESFTRAINKYSDYTNEEFLSMYTGLKPELDQRPRENRIVAKYDPNFKAPASVDWVSQGYTTPIKNQGQCGSCWAFATAGVMESRKLIANKTPYAWYDLSEQHLIECSSDYGNQKCQGGLMTNAYNYLLKAKHGSQPESYYPYVSFDGNNGTQCKYDSSKSQFGITGYTELDRDDKVLEQYVALGPVAVGVNANDWKDYGTGVFCKGVLGLSGCSGLLLNHAVIVEGYTQDYWLIRNSWGLNWGEGGYMKLCRKYTNNCGINKMASFPLV